MWFLNRRFTLGSVQKSSKSVLLAHFTYYITSHASLLAYILGLLSRSISPRSEQARHGREGMQSQWYISASCNGCFSSLQETAYVPLDYQVA